jgi:hypothetical protein
LKLRLTIDFNLELIDDDADTFPIVDTHEGEHIVSAPESDE